MSKRATITDEEFEAWRGNTVTQAVMRRFEAVTESIAEYWGAQLRMQGSTDQLLLTLLRVELAAKIEILDGLKNLALEDIIEEDDADRNRIRIGEIAKQAAASAKGKGH